MLKQLKGSAQAENNSASRQGGALRKRILTFRRKHFLLLTSETHKEGVLPMEYLVILALLLVLATGYIEAAKR